MYKKQNGLAMNREKLEKTYILETKVVSLSSAARVMGKKGIKK
jgi:hypothetical protein